MCGSISRSSSRCGALVFEASGSEPSGGRQGGGGGWQLKNKKEIERKKPNAHKNLTVNERMEWRFHGEGRRCFDGLTPISRRRLGREGASTSTSFNINGFTRKLVFFSSLLFAIKEAKLSKL